VPGESSQKLDLTHQRSQLHFRKKVAEVEGIMLDQRVFIKINEHFY